MRKITSVSRLPDTLRKLLQFFLNGKIRKNPPDGTAVFFSPRFSGYAPRRLQQPFAARFQLRAVVRIDKLPRLDLPLRAAAVIGKFQKIIAVSVARPEKDVLRQPLYGRGRVAFAYGGETAQQKSAQRVAFEGFFLVEKPRNAVFVERLFEGQRISSHIGHEDGDIAVTESGPLRQKLFDIRGDIFRLPAFVLRLENAYFIRFHAFARQTFGIEQPRAQHFRFPFEGSPQRTHLHLAIPLAGLCKGGKRAVGIYLLFSRAEYAQHVGARLGRRADRLRRLRRKGGKTKEKDICAAKICVVADPIGPDIPLLSQKGGISLVNRRQIGDLVLQHVLRQERQAFGKGFGRYLGRGQLRHRLVNTFGVVFDPRGRRKTLQRPFALKLGHDSPDRHDGTLLGQNPFVRFQKPRKRRDGRKKGTARFPRQRLLRDQREPVLAENEIPPAPAFVRRRIFRHDLHTFRQGVSIQNRYHPFASRTFFSARPRQQARKLL